MAVEIEHRDDGSTVVNCTDHPQGDCPCIESMAGQLTRMAADMERNPGSHLFDTVTTLRGVRKSRDAVVRAATERQEARL